MASLSLKKKTAIPWLSGQQPSHSEGLDCGAMHFYAYKFSSKDPKGRDRLGGALIVQVMQRNRSSISTA